MQIDAKMAVVDKRAAERCRYRAVCGLSVDQYCPIRRQHHMSEGEAAERREGEEEPRTFCQRRERRELRFCTERDDYHRSRWLTVLGSPAVHAAACRPHFVVWPINFCRHPRGETSDAGLIVGRKLRESGAVTSQ